MINKITQSEWLFKLGCRLNILIEFPEGLSPLEHAITKGYIHSVKYLIENGADLARQNESGRTPLMCASGLNPGSIDSVRLLIEESDIDCQDDIGRTALMHACQKFDDKIKIEADEEIRLLIDSGAKRNLQDINGRTAFRYLLENSNTFLGVGIDGGIFVKYSRLVGVIEDFLTPGIDLLLGLESTGISDLDYGLNHKDPRVVDALKSFIIRQESFDSSGRENALSNTF